MSIYMKKLEPLFGYDVNYDAEGNIEVNDLPNYPQETKNAKIFYERLELIKIDESKISFPLRLNHWVVTINPNDKATIMNYFNIKGIKKVVEEHKSKLFESTTFVKAELQYPKKTKYPNLHIHFYQVVNEGGEEIIDEYDMIDFCQIIYENTKQFTKKRIEDEKLAVKLNYA
ncbi:MAG: hypothetical protein EBS55_07110, partial [Flavobacteriaceae bacterium]|nr:hypothetical protein [Flavobacteriaceae bacterium]